LTDRNNSRHTCVVILQHDVAHPRSVCQVLAEEADDVVCATMPDEFDAVGQVFVDFHQVSDDEVRDLLATPPGS